MALLAIGGSAWGQSVNDVLMVGQSMYKIKGTNLFVNGSFDNGVDGWKATNYSTAAVASNFTITNTGGCDGGAYITTNGAGASDAKTIRQAVQVENGKKYLFRVYTSGKAPKSDNYKYNALFKMSNATTEATVEQQFAWPQGAEKTTNDWNRTQKVFTAESNYYGVRMGWNASSKFDGFSIMEVEDYDPWTNVVTYNEAENLDFATGAIDKGICTYMKDIKTNNTEYSQMLQIPGWLQGKENGDARAAGIVTYGTSDVWLGSNDAIGAIPTQGPDNSNGNGLGIVGVWSGTVQYVQPVRLPAGSYTISYYICNTTDKSSINKNLCGFITKAGEETLSSTKNFAKDSWIKEDVNLILTEETEGYISVGFEATNVGSANATRLFVDRIEIKSALDAAKENFAIQQAIAQGYLDNDEYAGITGSERTDLQTKAADLDDDITLEAANTAIEDLKTAITTFTGAKATYDKYDAQTANAKAIGVTDEALNNARPESVSDLQNALNRIIVLEDQAATAGYTMDATNIFGTWTQQNTGSTSGQHWSGDSRSYIDKNNTQGFTMSVTNTVTLPAGKYVFKAAARMAKDYNNYGFRMSTKIGDNTIEQNFVDKGSEGYGIDKTGAANYTEADDTYCNDNKGRGWEWRFIGFELQEETEVTMSVFAQVLANGWVSFSDIALLTTDDNEAMIAQLVAKAKEELQSDINKAPSHEVNVGAGAFQIPTSAATTYAAAKAAVQAAHDAQDATLESIATAKSDLATAINTFLSSELSVPEETDVYNLTLTDYNTAKSVNNVLTFKDGNSTSGGYSIGYTNEAGSYLNQSIHFAKTSEANTYNMYIVDANDKKQYICVGSKYTGGNDNQLRVSDNVEDALAVKIEISTEEGIYNLRNTTANALIGSNGDIGFFTANKYNKFTITEAVKCDVTLAVSDVKWATFIAPFDVDINTGVMKGLEAYTVTVENNELTLANVQNTIPANTPVMLNKDVTGDALIQNLSDYGKATKQYYTVGNLVGNLEAAAKIAETTGKTDYLLQKNNDVLGFYKLASHGTLKVGKNRAYLQIDTPASNVKEAFFFGETGDETAISALEALTSGNAKIYDINGRQQQKLQKGINIVNGKKILVK